MIDERDVTAAFARDHLSDLLGRAEYAKERVVIRKRRKRVAALVPIEDLELLEALEDERDLADIRARLKEWKRSGEPLIPIEKIARKYGVKL